MLRSRPLPLFLLLLAGCQSGTASDPVILRLNEQEVRRSDFDSYLNDMEKQQGGAIAPDVRTALLTAFLERRLLVLEARAQGMVQAGASMEQEQAAVQELLAREVHARVQVDEREVEEHFAAHRAEFTVPETIVLRQILVNTSNEARDVQRRLLKDPEALRDAGPDRLAGAGGAQRWPHGPVLPRAAAAGAGDGRVRAGPRPDRRRGGEQPGIPRAASGVARAGARPDLDECRPRIRTLLLAQKQERSEREFIAGLMARAKVNHEAAQARPVDS